MAKTHQLVFLHGLGETPAVWNPVIDRLPACCKIHSPAIVTVADFKHGWDIKWVTDRIAEEIDQSAHIVGLSLGAVVALDLAIRYPGLVHSLLLSAPQVRPSRTLMSFQTVAMCLLPSRLVCPANVTKSQLIQVLDSLASIDLEPDLPGIRVPTTVVCGEKDRANRPAARTIAEAIPDARCELIENAPHQWHTMMPAEFTQTLRQHLSRIGVSPTG